MKQKFLSTALLTVLSLFIFTSCSDDDDEKSIVGEWVYESIEFEILVDGTDFIDYYTQELGYTEKEAAAQADIYKSFGEAFKDIDFTFNSDGTYEVFGQEAGTWSLSSDESELIFNEGTENESALQIFELTDHKLSIGLDQSLNQNLDEDEALEEVSIKFVLTFTK